MNLISLAATAKKVCVAKNTLRRMIDRGDFVRAVQIAPRRIAFVEGEVDDWILSRPRGHLPEPCTGRNLTSMVAITSESQ